MTSVEAAGSCRNRVPPIHLSPSDLTCVKAPGTLVLYLLPAGSSAKNILKIPDPPLVLK